MYRLPQAGILANNLLCERHAEFDYYKAATTPGLWRHKWRPIMFALIVDDFASNTLATPTWIIFDRLSSNTTKSPKNLMEPALQASH
jgi:hypothetical protein